MKQTLLLSAAALAAALLAAPAAQAFTFQGQAPGDSGAKAYVDPMQNVSPQAQDNGSHFDNRGAIPQQQNGLYFGVGRNSEAGSFDQRYNSNNLFDPYAREGR
jgi:hypothetical protein